MARLVPETWPLKPGSASPSQTRQPLAGLRGAELAGALVPFARQRKIGHNPLRLQSAELRRVICCTKSHGRRRQPLLGSPQVELAGNLDSAVCKPGGRAEGGTGAGSGREAAEPGVWMTSVVLAEASSRPSTPTRLMVMTLSPARPDGM